MPISAIKNPATIIIPSRLSSPRVITVIPSAGIAFVSGIGSATAVDAIRQESPTNCSQ